MRPGKSKSRTLGRKKVRLPGGKTAMHYSQKKPSKQRCISCGSYLHGVARESALRLGRIPKTKKRPERAYGGVLCSKCSREKIKEEARKNV